VRKSGLAILGLLVYAWVLEPILHNAARSPGQVFPDEGFGSLDTLPEQMLEMLTGPTDLPPEQAVFPASLTVCCFAPAYVLLRVRDL